MSGLILGITGTAISATTAGISFSQASKAKKRAKDADMMAQKYIDRAKSNIVDRYATLGISKQPYKQESDAIIAAGAQLTQQAAEGDQRGVAATAGQIGQVQTKQQADVANRMSQDIQNLEQVKAKGATEADTRREAVELGLANREFSKANVEEAKAQQAMKQGLTAAGQAVSSGIGIGVKAFGGGEFGKAQRALQKGAGGNRGGTDAIQSRFTDLAQNPTAPENVAATKLIGTKMANSPQFKDAWSQMSAGTFSGNFDDFLGSNFSAQDLMDFSTAFGYN